MSSPVVLVIPYPAQGHVNPMMSLSQKLVHHGCNIIFVNTDFNHERVMSSMENQQRLHQAAVKLVSIPDGLGPAEADDRNNFGELSASMLRTMPAKLEKFIQDTNLNGEIRISCVVADVSMGWALEVASKLGIRGALFWPASAAEFALQYNVPKLIDDGLIDSDGLPTTTEPLQLYPSMPAMDTKLMWWSNLLDSMSPKKFFHYVVHCMLTPPNLTSWWLCNSTPDLEPEVLSSIPKLLPIGPLLITNDNTSADSRSLGQFWEEDLSCMTWLDQQPRCSVIYVAFGSITVFDQKQFTELALGLDLTDRPFLWVVREDPNSKTKMCYPTEFRGSKGKIVGWAPQQKVLSHPAIACFVSHCGWNSTVEGLSNGVPFLCCPYFADQIYNKTFICDQLKAGLGFDLDENGLVPRGEVKVKVDQLLSDENMRSRLMELKEKLMKSIARGPSLENLVHFCKWLKTISE